MKHRIVSVVLAAALMAACFGGCSLVANEYLSVEPHSKTYDQEPRENDVTVADYTELKNSLLSLVVEGVEEALISSAAYDGNMELDYARAVRYVTETNPLGAYAVESIEEETTHITSYSQIVVHITYRHTLEEIGAITPVRGMSGAQSALQAALESFVPQLVLRVTGYSDADFDEMAREYCRQNQTTAIERPDITVSVYPNTGNVRIVELQFAYDHSQQELRSMRAELNAVLHASYSYVNYRESIQERAALLYSFLAERFEYIEGETTTPAYSLLCEGVLDDRSLANVYRAMCENVDIPCIVVEGTYKDAEYCWNIIQIGDTYCHVDLLGAYRAGLQELPMLTDSQMTGFAWDTEQYPSCQGLYEPPAEEPTGNEAVPAAPGTETSLEPEEEVPPTAPDPPVDGNPEDAEPPTEE